LRTNHLIKDLKTESLKLKQNDREGLIWSQDNYPFGYTSYGSSGAGYDRMHLVSSTFGTLKKQIDRHLKRYIKQLDYDIEFKDLRMTHCWVNVMGQGATHQSHHHPLSVISGTFYVDANTKSSALKFEDPRQMFYMNTPAVKKNAALKNKRFHELKPQPNQLVLFESWLKHEVPMHTEKKERISISFNYGWN
jgi:uncharacterized protein (TIGR02466 family)